MNEHPELIAKILELRKTLLDEKPNIRCMVISVLEKGSDTPVVVYHGDQLEYTALAVEVAKVLRRRVVDRIDGTQPKGCNESPIL